MEMEMHDGLAGVRAVVVDHAVAAVVEPVLAGEPGREEECVREDGPVLLTNVAQCGEVFARDDKDVHRSLWRQIAEGDVVLALGDELGAELAARDAAEDAVDGRRIRHCVTCSESVVLGVVRSGFHHSRLNAPRTC
jgi:hypothetical protein